MAQQKEDPMGRHWRLGMMLGVLVACPSLSDAKDLGSGAKCTLSLTKRCIPSAWTAAPGYLAQARQKLVFGGKNVLLGWLELYDETRDAIRHDEGFFRGMGRGLVNMLGDTVGGAVHMATFPITAVDIPLPDGGTDIF